MVKKKKFFPFLIIALIIAITVGSIAYFSDRATTNSSGNTGNLGITLNCDNIDLFDSREEINKSINVGSVTDFQFEVTNNNKASVDIFATITMNASNELLTNTPSDFEIYWKDDVTVTDGGYTIKEGATPVGAKTMSEDRKTIIYELEAQVASGSSSFEERNIEYINADGNVITLGEYNKLSNAEKGQYTMVSETKVFDLVLVFNSNSAIDSTELEFIIEVEAVQHRDGNSWTDSAEDKKYGKTTPGFEAEPSIKIEKTSDKKTYFRGETIRYTITVTNTGNVPLTNVVVTEMLEGGQFVPQEGVTIDGLTATIAEIPVEGVVELTFTYKIPTTNNSGGGGMMDSDSPEGQ